MHLSLDICFVRRGREVLMDQETENEQDKPKIRRLACTACRSVKGRCLPSDPESPYGTCQRCKQVGLTCFFEQRKYGAAKRRPSSSDDGTRRVTPRLSIDAGPSMQATLGLSPFVTPAQLTALPAPSHPLHPPPLPPPISSVRHDTVFPTMRPPDMFDRLDPVNPPTTSTDASATSSHAADFRHPQSVDVSEHLDPEIPDPIGIVNGQDGFTHHEHQPQSSTDWTTDDPVLLQLLNPQEAQRLFSLFHEYLNPMIALFDPAFHTFSYVRLSPILLSSILSASAKFFRPTLQRALYAHAQMLLNRAIHAGACDVAIIQALMIQVFWKDPVDRSAWVKIGIGIRLGYQLRLHLPLAPEASATSQGRDAKRTWYCLTFLDKRYSDMFRLPITISLEDLTGAYTGTQHALSADAHLACSMALQPAHAMWIKFKQQPQAGNAEWQKGFLKEIFAQHEQHLHTWFSDENNTSLSIVEHRFLKWYDLNLMLQQKFEIMLVAPLDERAELLHDCLALAHSVVDQLDLVADSGSLLYLQDTSASHLSTFGIILYKLFWRLGSAEQKTIITMIKRVYRRCNEVAKSELGTIMAIVTRFLQRTLKNIAHESRAPSRMPSPPAGDVNGRNVELERQHIDEVTFDIDRFLQTEFNPNDSSHIVTGLDDQYWATLFSTPQLNFGLGT